MVDKKRCGHCKFPLPIKEFTNNKRNADGLSSNCRVCAKDIQDERLRRKQDERKSGQSTAPISLR
ncbi:hypothetical protein LCGC14_3138680 [marine sediment metagenome]|uniref:Uncharacterized protein n=1 Tax=marine sediment metagenome TaxID=412755 RepID=A0A0F8WLH2_9ZZZZ